MNDAEVDKLAAESVELLRRYWFIVSGLVSGYLRGVNLSKADSLRIARRALEMLEEEGFG